MDILKIEINNYRSCIDTKINFQKKLTTLIGINGVGKTNILYSFRLFNRVFNNRFRHYPLNVMSFLKKERGLLETAMYLEISIEKKIVYLRAKFVYDTDEKNNDDVLFSEIKYRIEGENPRKWTKVDRDILDMYEFRHISRRNGKKITDKALLTVNIIEGLSNISYYSATQFSDPSKCPVSIELDDYKLGYKRSTNKDLEKTHQRFLYDLYNSKKDKSPIYKLFFNTVSSEGLGLVENISFLDHTIPNNSYKVRTGGKVQRIDNKKKIVIPSFKVDGLDLSPNQLSEGTFKTLALIFYILSDKNPLILIEEPEISIHHGLLNSIIQLIKVQSNKKQIIISTHSDYVLDKLRPENIVIVKKDKKKGTIANSLGKVLSHNDYRALKEYLNTSGNLGEYWKEGGFDYE